MGCPSSFAQMGQISQLISRRISVESGAIRVLSGHKGRNIVSVCHDFAIGLSAASGTVAYPAVLHDNNGECGQVLILEKSFQRIRRFDRRCCAGGKWVAEKVNDAKQR